MKEEEAMIEIGLPTFADFVLASGAERVTVVQTAKGRYPKPDNCETDLYAPLKEIIIDAARQNLTSRETRTLILDGLCHLDDKKAAACDECIIGYEQWRKRKHFVWEETVASKTSTWKHECLTIRIAPELGVLIHNSRHIIQLYFKEEILSIRRLHPILYLLDRHAKKYGRATVGLLDVRRGQFYAYRKEISGINQLLVGEAAAFQTMWNHL